MSSTATELLMKEAQFREIMERYSREIVNYLMTSEQYRRLTDPTKPKPSPRTSDMVQMIEDLQRHGGMPVRLIAWRPPPPIVFDWRRMYRSIAFQ